MRATQVCSIVGSISKVINNRDGLYEGNLRRYAYVIGQGRHIYNRYHNLGHNLDVVFKCWLGGKFYAQQSPCPISKRDIRSLLVAATWHDFDHIGRCGPDVPDSINLELAIRGLRRHILAEDKPYQTEIELLMLATEVPYKVASHKLPLLAQILRDADLSNSLSHTWIQHVAIGLGREQGKSFTDILGTQGEFYSKYLKFETDWAKAEFPQIDIQEKIIEAAELYEIFTDPSE